MTSAPTPTETFKRALAASTKALSGKRDVDVRFGGDVAGVVVREGETQIALPMPAAKSPASKR